MRLVHAGSGPPSFRPASMRGRMELHAPGTIDPPEAPTGLAASSENMATSSLGDEHIALTWDAPVTEPDSFNIYRRRDTAGYSLYGSVAGSETSFEDHLLQRDSVYKYRITAVNEGGESGNSNEAEGAARPAHPTFVEALGTGGTDVEVNFGEDSKTATNYNISRRKTPSGSVESSVSSVLSGASPHDHTITPNDPSDEYEYGVRLIDSDHGTWSSPNDDRFHESDTATADVDDGAGSGGSGSSGSAPSSPTLSITDRDDGSIDVSSTNPSGTDGIRFYASTTEDFAPGPSTEVQDSSSTTLNHSGLSADETWYFKAVAYNEHGDSDPSDQVSETTWPDAPKNVSAIRTSSGEANPIDAEISWDEGTRDEGGVELDWSNDGGSSWNALDTAALGSSPYSWNDVESDGVSDGDDVTVRVRFTTPASSYGQDSFLAENPV